MSEVISLEPSGGRALRHGNSFRIVANAHKNQSNGFFNRRELDAILQVYSRGVMNGEWRDYAIGHDDDVAVFEIFGNQSSLPLFRIFKRAKSDRRGGRYQVADRLRVLLTGKNLDDVLKIVNRRKPKLVR